MPLSARLRHLGLVPGSPAACRGPAFILRRIGAALGFLMAEIIRNVLIALATIATASTIPTLAACQQLSREEAATLTELSSEMTECAAFFVVSSTCFVDHPDPRAADLVRDYRQAADRILKLAFETGKPAGLTMEGLASQHRLAGAAMRTSINNSCANISILAEKYGMFCQQLAQNPVVRLNELIAGKRCNGSYRCD
jgi:hypothetical protein